MLFLTHLPLAPFASPLALIGCMFHVHVHVHGTHRMHVRPMHDNRTCPIAPSHHRAVLATALPTCVNQLPGAEVAAAYFEEVRQNRTPHDTSREAILARQAASRASPPRRASSPALSRATAAAATTPRGRLQSAVRSASPRRNPLAAAGEAAITRDTINDLPPSHQQSAPSSTPCTHSGRGSSLPSPRLGAGRMSPQHTRPGSGGGWATARATVGSGHTAAAGRSPSPRQVSFDQISSAPQRQPSPEPTRALPSPPVRDGIASAVTPSDLLLPSPALPPPPRAPLKRGSSRERMAELTDLFKAELITKGEFEAKRKAILDAL